jgi:hypothetical protein
MTRLVGCLVLMVFVPVVLVAGLYIGAFHLLAAFAGSSVSLVAGHPDRPMASTRLVLNYPTAERWFSPLAAMEAALFARTLADDRIERKAIAAAVLATARATDQAASDGAPLSEIEQSPLYVPTRPRPVWVSVTQRGDAWQVQCYHPDSGWTEWTTNLTTVWRR